MLDDNAGYSVDKHNDKLLTADTRSKLDKIKKDIVAGKIKVPDYYEQKK